MSCRWLLRLALALGLLGAGLLTAVLVAPALLLREEPTRAGLVYTPSEWPQPLAGDFYRPQGTAPVPAVLLIHGGGWHSGQRWHMGAYARRLVAAGYAAFTIDYRLVPEHRFPAQLDDVRQALHWLRANAGPLRIEADRIGVWGYSAGAHLAALLALTERDSALRAVVAGGLPADFMALQDSELVIGLMGGTRDRIGDARFREASPRFQVDAGDPPVFLFHARWDRIVPTRQATDMKMALDAAGVPNELVWLERRHHAAGFFFNGDAVEAALRFLDRWLKEGRSS